MGGTAVAAVPAVTSRRRPEIRAACDHSAAQAPARTVTEEQLGALLLRRRELVGHHQLDGRTRQDALAAVPPLVQEHALEGEIVVDRRDQAAAARFEDRRPAPAAVAGVVEEGELRAVLRIGHVVAGEPPDLVGRHLEAGVAHAERPEQVILHEGPERLARGARDQHAQHLRAGVIEPALAGLIGQRQAADPLHELVGRNVRRDWDWAPRRRPASPSGWDAVAARPSPRPGRR